MRYVILITEQDDRGAETGQSLKCELRLSKGEWVIVDLHSRGVFPVNVDFPLMASIARALSVNGTSPQLVSTAPMHEGRSTIPDGPAGNSQAERRAREVARLRELYEEAKVSHPDSPIKQVGVKLGFKLGTEYNNAWRTLKRAGLIKPKPRGKKATG